MNGRGGFIARLHQHEQSSTARLRDVDKRLNAIETEIWVHRHRVGLGEAVAVGWIAAAEMRHRVLCRGVSDVGAFDVADDDKTRGPTVGDQLMIDAESLRSERLEEGDVDFDRGCERRDGFDHAATVSQDRLRGGLSLGGAKAGFVGRFDGELLRMTAGATSRRDRIRRRRGVLGEIAKQSIGEMHSHRGVLDPGSMPARRRFVDEDYTEDPHSSQRERVGADMSLARLLPFFPSLSCRGEGVQQHSPGRAG